MRRDLKKSIEAYQKKFYNATSNAGAFFASDVKQILDSATTEDGEVSLFDVISNALEAGFMVGYRCAKNEARKK